MDPEARQSVSAAALFQCLWDELVGLIGTPATAALLRRGVKRATARRPGVALPVVQREGLDFACTLPPAWHDGARADAVEELRGLVRDDLDPLFRELTGPVVARRLAQVPELVQARIAGVEERS